MTEDDIRALLAAAEAETGAAASLTMRATGCVAWITTDDYASHGIAPTAAEAIAEATARHHARRADIRARYASTWMAPENRRTA